MHPVQADELPVWNASSSLGKPMRFVLTSCKLLVADGLGLAMGYWLLRGFWPAAANRLDEPLMVVLGAAYFAVAWYGGSHAPAVAANAARSVQRAWLALLITFLMVAVVGALFGHVVNRIASTLAPALICAAFSVGLARLGLATLLASRWWRERAAHARTLVLVDGEASGMAATGGVVIDAQAHRLRPDVNDPEALARLGALVGDADRVVIACSNERRSSWVAALRGANVPVEILVDEIGELAPLGTGRFGEMTTLKVAGEPLTFDERLVKRLFDIIVAGAALVFLAPLLLVVALAIKLDTPGPVMFRQPRIGRGNRLFRMHKFRSMRVEVQDLHGSKLTAGRDDNRVTRVGRFIRATSIDELPQLIDVLRGDMTIVGPRPHALGARAGGKLYWEVDAAYWHRHAVKPGMTGLAQVRGFRGTTFVDADLQNRLDADLEYIRDWSLAGDMRIICRTVMALAGHSVF